MRVMMVALLLGLAGCASHHMSPAPDLLIVNANVIRLTSGEVRPGQMIAMRDGVIVDVSDNDVGAHTGAGRVVDGEGGYVIPGLIDAHAHLEHDENPDVLKLFVAYGVTTVRSMDGRPHILEWRDRVASEELIGPRIYTAGPILDGQPPVRPDNTVVADPAAGRAAVAAQAEAGYDFIKVYDRVSEPTFDAILHEAQRRSMRIGGHPPSAIAIADVMREFWTIEHVTSFMDAIRVEGAEAPWWIDNWLGAPMDRTRAERLAVDLARSGLWVVPTLWERERSAAQPEALEEWMRDPALAYVGEPARDFWRETMIRISRRFGEDEWQAAALGHAQRLALTKVLYDAGVRLVVGTDTPNAFVVPGESVHREIEMFVAAGIPPRQALLAATSRSIEMLYGDAEEPIRVGARADLLILAANPLEDIVRTRAISGLVIAGRYLDRPALDDIRDDYAADADAAR